MNRVLVEQRIVAQHSMDLFSPFLLLNIYEIFSTYEKDVFTKLPKNWHTRALYTLWYISRMFDNGIFQNVPEGPLNLSNVLESL
jgi:hypothetical protein